MTAVTDNLGRNIAYTYDANSNRLSMASPAGTTAYAYNALNRLISEINPSNRTFNFSYNLLGQRTGLNYPNGVTTTYNYDAINRLVSMLTQNTVPSTINTYTYTHDNVGNRTGMTDTTGTNNYTYDEIYRLVQSTHPTLPTEQYSYDPVGNRAGTTVDVGNRLLEDATYTYQYDNNGNITQKTNRTTGEITTLTYDTQNRLVQATKPGTTASYKYDPLGRRIEKNVNGIITKYLYDNEDIVIEYDGNGNMIAKYTHGTGIDEPLSMEKNGQEYYYHQDGLGSVTALTDGVGDLAHRYEYNTYGKIISVLDPILKQPYLYTGREYDEETGLYYYRARSYDADTGRFINEDPLRLNGRDVNLFRYVGNNPVNFVDPLGLYGTQSCSYYEQACAINGGFYECHMAQSACNIFPSPNDTLDCIRQCLQEKHKARQPEGECSDKGQTGSGDFASEHQDCFSGCFQNPENPYDPQGPYLPDGKVTLY